MLCISRFVRGFVLPEGSVALFYVVNLLQWVIILQKRLVYYYYYPPAMFLGVAIVIVLSRANGPRVFGIRVSVDSRGGSGLLSLLLPSHDGVGSTLRLHVGLLVARIPGGQNARKPNGSVPKWERHRFPN